MLLGQLNIRLCFQIRIPGQTSIKLFRYCIVSHRFDSYVTGEISLGIGRVKMSHIKITGMLYSLFSHPDRSSSFHASSSGQLDSVMSLPPICRIAALNGKFGMARRAFCLNCSKSKIVQFLTHAQ